MLPKIEWFFVRMFKIGVYKLKYSKIWRLYRRNCFVCAVSLFLALKNKYFDVLLIISVI